ncbi:hypothetical protein SKAU_G00101250 [Synaphobranchus kaupii]|uniref:Uncharacterized protein n=1 Tax=Synaphobranchus kaupii TaxID=118154 RepID=A0A9Q1J6D9_SYNKA|nr:hypothetical protein SKAU_G00101250 [Synaphobranchus kaupii]
MPLFQLTVSEGPDPSEFCVLPAPLTSCAVPGRTGSQKQGPCLTGAEQAAALAGQHTSERRPPPPAPQEKTAA